MAVVGEAYVVIRARTNQVEADIRRGFSRSGAIASSAGRTAGERFNAGFKNSSSDNIFGKFSAGLSQAVAGADAARARFHDLVRTGYTLGTAFAGAVGGISAAISAIASLAATAAGAIGSVVALGQAVASIGVGIGVAKLALGGVGKAVKALTSPTGGGGGGGGSKGTKGTKGTDNTAAIEKANQKAIAAANKANAAAKKRYAEAVDNANADVEKAEKSLAQVIQDNRARMIDANNDVRDAQLALNDAIKEGQEYIKQLGFQSEDAALQEKQAALELEKARLRLLAVQDLPPNSAARREAELSYQQADLAYREAKSNAQDLLAEQDRLAKTGVSGTDAVKNATSALAAAEAARAKQAVQNAQDQADAQDALLQAQKDARETIADKPEMQTPELQTPTKTPGTPGTGGSSGGGGGGADPFAGLNQAQIDFAKFIASLKPKFDELKKIAAEGFLPPLQKAIQNLVDNAYPTVAYGVGVVAAAMGTAVITISEAITAGNHMKELATFFDTAAHVIVDLGKVIGSVFGIVLSIFTASAPLTVRFADAVAAAADRMDAWLNGLQNNGSLEDFFNRSGDLMAQFGTIFGNIFEGLGHIIEANFGPSSGGQILLTWITKATDGFANIDQGTLNKYFVDVANNAKAIGGALGGVLKVFIDLGADPNIGKAFQVLQLAQPAMADLATNAAKSAPKLAELVVKVVQIMDKLSDSGAVDIFFETLTHIADAVSDLLSNKALGGLLVTTGRVAAALAALGLVGKIVGFGFKSIVGSVALASRTLGGAYTAVTTVGKGAVTTIKGVGELAQTFKLARQYGASFKDTMSLMTSSTNPLVKGLGKAGLLVQSFGSGVANAAVGMGKFIAKAAIQTATVAKLIIQSGIYRAKQLLGIAVTEAETAAQAGLNIALLANPIGLVVIALVALVGAFILAYNNIKPFRDFMDGLWGHIVDGFKAGFEGVKRFFGFIGDLFSGFIDFVRDIFGIHSPSTVFADIGKFIVEGFVNGFKNLLQLVGSVWNGVIDFFSGFFDDLGSFVKSAVDIIVNLFLNFTPYGLIIKNWGPILDFITGLFTNISAFIGSVLGGIGAFIGTTVANISLIWNTGWQMILDFFNGIWNSMVVFYSPILQGISDFINTVIQGISLAWTTTWQSIVDFFSLIWNTMVVVYTPIIQGISDFIASVIGGISAGWSATWKSIGDFFKLIWEVMVLVYTPILQGIKNFISGTISGIRSTWNSVWGAIRDVFQNVWNAIKSFVQSAIGFVRDIISKVTGNIRSTWSSGWNEINSIFKNVWNAIKSFVSSAIGSVRDTIARVIGGIRDTWSSIWNGIRSTFDSVWNGIKSAVGGFGTFFRNAFSGIRGFVTSAFAGVLGSVKAPINGIISLVNRAINSLNGLSVSIPSWVPGVGGQKWGLNLPTIPQLAKGGTVMASNGGTLVNVAEAGRNERIEPLDNDGLSARDKAMMQAFAEANSGTTIQIDVYPQPNQSPADIATEISRQLAFEMRKGGLK